MPKPFNDTLKELRFGQLVVELGEQVAAIAKACSETGRKGELTLKLVFRPGKAGQLEVFDDVKTKVPQFDRESTLVFVTPDGNLTREDPRQATLPGLRKVDTNPDAALTKVA
jgi:hypothetical protein